MNRRRFLSLFGVTAAAIAADPELALWTPGAKLISIPSVVSPPMPIFEHQSDLRFVYDATLHARTCFWNPATAYTFVRPPRRLPALALWTPGAASQRSDAPQNAQKARSDGLSRPISYGKLLDGAQ